MRSPFDAARNKLFNRRALTVVGWCGRGLGGGDVYRAGLKMIAELNGWTVTSARLAGA